MAYSPEQWERAKALFESGQFSLSEISEQIGISKSKISEKSKKEQWERGRNADYIEARKLVAKKQGTEKGTVIRTLDKVADDQIRREGLVFGGLEELAKLAGKTIRANKTVEKVNVGDGVQNFEPRELNPTDMKNLASTLTDVGKAFGLIETAKTEINNTNAQQVNTQYVGFTEIDPAT